MGNPRMTRNRPGARYSGFNFTLGFGSPFERNFAQPYGFACQRKALGNESGRTVEL